MGWSLGCATGELGPEPVEDLPIAFAAPSMVTVKSGDTLALLAKKNKVTVEDLRAWNGLNTDRIEVDQVLLVWMPAPKPVAPKAPPTLREKLESAWVAEAPAEPAVAPPIPAEGSPAVTPEEPAPAEAPVEAEPPPPRKIVAIERPALVSLMGLEVGTDVDLSEVAAGMERHDSVAGDGGLGDRSLGTGGEADDLELKQRQPIQLGPQIPTTPVALPRVTKPAPKRCLADGGATVISDNGTVSSTGLTVGQINASMGQISRYTVRCFPSGSKGTYGMVVALTVGCDGTVSNVFLVDSGVIPVNVTNCVTKTLAAAGFPAHGVPGGVEFEYPMKFSF
ncbi:MAG: LysM peptidoglycan-binding domain-containing protein [Myxococcota bacterium]